MTVNEKVAVCDSAPDVAVTVTVDVTGCEPPPLEEPPQPVNRLSPPTLTASNSSNCKRRRFLMPKQQSAIASAEPGMNGLGLR